MTTLTKIKSVVALIRPEITLAIGACVLVGEIVADFILAYSVLGVLRSRIPVEVKRIIRHILFGMLLGLLSFVIGVLYP